MNLTPEVVALIERDASERYGIRLRYSPDPEVVQAPPRKVTKTTKAKVTRAKPRSISEINQEILKRAREADEGLRAPDIDDLEPSAERRTELLKRLVAEEQLTKEGEGRATRYFAVADDGGAT